MIKMMMKFSIVLVFFLNACSCKKQNVSKLDEHQTFLVNGYSQMHQIMGAFKWTDELLLVKINSKEVKDFGGRLSEAASAIEERLETIASSEKWLTLDNGGASAVQEKVLSSMTKERIKSYAPVVGMNGPVFERTLLLVSSGILNQMQHLTLVMLGEEKDKTRLEFLKMANESFKKLREEDLKILNTTYFKHNKFSE